MILIKKRNTAWNWQCKTRTLAPPRSENVGYISGREERNKEQKSMQQTQLLVGLLASGISVSPPTHLLYGFHVKKNIQGDPFITDF
jgi:hypothetical protein